MSGELTNISLGLLDLSSISLSGRGVEGMRAQLRSMSSPWTKRPINHHNAHAGYKLPYPPANMRSHKHCILDVVNTQNRSHVHRALD